MDVAADDPQRRRLPPLDLLMCAVLIAGTLTAVLARMFSHVLHLSIDDWTYTVWGQAITDGRRPSLEYLLTAPKPLAYALGVVAAPFRPGYGIAVEIAIFGAVLVAAIAITVRQKVGFLGVPAALGFLAFTKGFRYNTQYGAADLVSAAMVVSALAVRGRWRVGLLVGAGLLRPEVWPVAALAGFLETSGTRPRRLIAGGLAGLMAPTVWALTDVAANGRPFMFLVVAQRDGTFSGSTTPSLGSSLHGFYHALSGNVGLLAVALGIAGLIFQAVRDHHAGHFDPLPVATVSILAAGVSAELWQGLPSYPRYTTSITALLLVGVGWLAGAVVPRADGWLAGTLATTASVLMIGFAVLFHPVSYAYHRPPHIERALPAIKQARVCGTISVAGRVHKRNPILSMLAALGRIPLTTFSPIQDGAWRNSGAILRVKPRAGHPPLNPTLSPLFQEGRSWELVDTSAGQLWLTEACVKRGGTRTGRAPDVGVRRHQR